MRRLIALLLIKPFSDPCANTSPTVKQVSKRLNKFQKKTLFYFFFFPFSMSLQFRMIHGVQYSSKAQQLKKKSSKMQSHLVAQFN